MRATVSVFYHWPMSTMVGINVKWNTQIRIRTRTQTYPLARTHPQMPWSNNIVNMWSSELFCNERWNEFFYFCFGLSRLLCAMITMLSLVTDHFFTNWALQFVFPIWKKQFKKWDVTACIVKPMVVPIVRLNRCKLKNFVFCIYSSLSNYISIIIMH